MVKLKYFSWAFWKSLDSQNSVATRLTLFYTMLKNMEVLL